MGFQNIMCSKRVRKLGISISSIAPFYSVGAVVPMASKTSAFIQALSNRAVAGTRAATIVMTSSANQTMYYAYPVSYGQALFMDSTTGFTGGWDGVHGDGGMTMGPIIVDVDVSGTIVPFYLYETDWPNLGLMTWTIT
jgi:hypothetical protein